MSNEQQDTWLRDQVMALHSKQDEMNGLLVEISTNQKNDSMRLDELEKELKPVVRHVDLVKGSIKIGLMLLTAAGAVAGCLKFL